MLDLTLQTTQGGCVFGNGPISGVACYDEATQRFYGLATFESRTNQFFVNGTRQ